MRLGKMLAKWRLFKDITVRELANEIGTSAPTLSRIESGENMDGDTLAKVLAYLFGEESK